jgi:hypothetical protein
MRNTGWPVVLVTIGFALASFIGVSHLGLAQTPGGSEPKVKNWGEATLILKDEKGQVIGQKSVKYPIPDASMVKAGDAPNNCWEYCRNVCDGYGVCWLSCGWHCSPWTK